MIIRCGTVVAAVAATACTVAAATLDDVPWIGDGRPERNGADWYDEDPAPEFMAEFVLPKGVEKEKIHFACAGFGWVTLNGFAIVDPYQPSPWSVYGKTVYSMTESFEEDYLADCFREYPATNTVRVYLGNGFYNLPPLRFWGSKCFREALAHGRPCFKLAIDGFDKPLEWKWRETNILRNSVYLGVEVDSTRQEGRDWKPAAVVAGPKGKIVEWQRTELKTTAGQAVGSGKPRWLREGEVKRRIRIGCEIEREIAEKVAAFPKRRGVSIRTALVYEGELDDSVARSGAFDILVPFARLLER